MNKNFDKSFGFAIHDVARLLRVSFDRQAANTGLTRAQWSVLAHLHRGNGVQQKTLAKVMDITPITLARHLDRLEVDAWIERRDDPEDRRAKRVTRKYLCRFSCRYARISVSPIMAKTLLCKQRILIE